VAIAAMDGVKVSVAATTPAASTNSNAGGGRREAHLKVTSTATVLSLSAIVTLGANGPQLFGTSGIKMYNAVQLLGTLSNS
jgi:hypothetical protein